MPVAEIAVPGPLRQGDILKGLLFYTTGANGAHVGDGIPYSVVISRDCKALRAETILVAEIRPYKPEAFRKILSGEMSFDQARRTLDALRDGDEAPDRFYLGPLRDCEERFAIALDRIHTVSVPVDEKRTRWIENHRVLRLTTDFIRHLHIRLFSSIARQGFDDHGWWPTQDLKALVLVGQNELMRLSAESSDAELKLKAAEVDGGTHKKIEGHRNDFQKNARKVEELKKALQPYQDELTRRSPDEGS